MRFLDTSGAQRPIKRHTFFCSEQTARKRAVSMKRMEQEAELLRKLAERANALQAMQKRHKQQHLDRQRAVLLAMQQEMQSSTRDESPVLAVDTDPLPTPQGPPLNSDAEAPTKPEDADRVRPSDVSK